MADERLIDSAIASLSSGVSEDEIRAGYLKASWSPEEINGALAVAKLRMRSPAMYATAFQPSNAAPAPAEKYSGVVLNIIFLIVLALGAGSLYAGMTKTGNELRDKVFSMLIPETPVAEVPVVVASSSETTRGTTTPPVPAAKPVPVVPAASLPIPTVSFTESATSVSTGSPLTLSWTSINATSCTGDGFPTTGYTNGSATVKVYGSFEFSLTCRNASHATTRTVSVQVTGS